MGARDGNRPVACAGQDDGHRPGEVLTMILLILIAGALVVLAALLSATSVDSRPVQPVVMVVEEPAGSRIDLTVTVILLVIVLLGLLLFRTTS
jgi:hypothetical protein